MKLYKQLSLKSGEDMEWRLLKIPLMIAWRQAINHVLTTYHHPLPQDGIMGLLPFEYLAPFPVRLMLMVVSSILALMYVFEIRIKPVMVMLTVLSFIVFSYEEANGVHNRTAIFTAILFVQTLAYFLKKDLAQNRIQFSVQIVAAIYVLACISKLSHSGLNWIYSGPYFFLQMKKEAYFGYYETGTQALFKEQLPLLDFFTSHPGLLTFLMILVLAIEGFAWISMINKKNRLGYGILILLLQTGIYIFMHILIRPIAFSAIIILINPLYLLYKMIYLPLVKKQIG
jgi:hypothetical protein